MKQVNRKSYILWILFIEAVGALAGMLTREGTQMYSESLTKPPLSPPAILFPIVWIILFALMGISAARIYNAPPSNDRSRSLTLFLVQLAFNFFWSIIFFNLEAPVFALFWLILLWLLILAMTAAFRKVDRIAALLQIPYLLWTTFAVYLNLGIALLNQ